MARHNGLLAGADDSDRNFRRIVALLIWLVIVPTAALLVLAIFMLVYWETEQDVIFGVLAMTLVGCLVTGGVLALVFLRREANLSKLQLDFVSKVSHELRTPLTSIRMFADMLRENAGNDPEETKLCLDVLQKETERLSERIERLLDWGRMEAGRRIYQLEPCSVEEIVAEALRGFDTNHIGHALDVHVDLEEALPLVDADRAALGDALINLLTNAVKYSEGVPEITVGVRVEGRSLRISVRDKGIGIPRREQSMVFQKFYRSNELLSREVEGSGLGLAIVRHVALGHGGRVEVKSEPGRGSTFTVVLPMPASRRQSSIAPAPAT